MDAKQLAAEDGDRAMAWLTESVAAGYHNRADLEQDSDLVYLLRRDDFQKLLASLLLPAK